MLATGFRRGFALAFRRHALGRRGDRCWDRATFARSRWGRSGHRCRDRFLRRSFLRRRCLRQPRQRLDQVFVFARAFVAVGLDAFQHLSDGIHHAQQSRGDLRMYAQFSIAQLAQQIFANMRNRLQFCESQKATGSLDRVDGAEDTRQRSPVSRIFFQLD